VTKSNATRAFEPATRRPPTSAGAGAHGATRQPLPYGIELADRARADSPGPQISAPGDPSEQEADAVADRVMRMADPGAVGFAGAGIQRKCRACDEEDKQQIQTKRDPSASESIGLDAGTAVHAATRGGTPLPAELRSYFEPRFGQSFGHVRVHTGDEAEAGARAVRARAYTTGRDIVFGAGQYAPETTDGKRLLAHELVHVVQQDTSGARGQVQRCPDAATDAVYDKKAAAIKAHAEYLKLSPGPKATADQVITDAKLRANCTYYVDKLQLLFDTPEASAATVTAQTQAQTVVAATAEKKRLAPPPPEAVKKGVEIEADKTGLEEQAGRSGRVWTKVPGKFGGGTYSIDNRDPLNIVVKAKVLLVKTGTGTDADVNAIKGMEDAIEKAASTTGYVVDLEFVNVADPDTFTAEVNPKEWEVATNWSGGSPRGFAHELHHMFAFVLDRYDYIQTHPQNASMKIPDRLIWFSKELTKPAGYNNNMSIMGYGDHPLDDDVCNVAGLLVPACVAQRTKMNQAFGDIFNAYPTFDQRVLNCIVKLQKADPDTMMGVLRELFRRMVGFQAVRKNITKRGKDAGDVFGKVFQGLKADQQLELLGIIAP
jgi:hypothetical protein